MRVFNRMMSGGLLGLAALLGAAPAAAEILTFDTVLDGNYGTAPTGSAATGNARINVDTTRRTISMDMTVDGISTDALWDKLVAAPIGPVHLHKYASAEGGSSVLVVPVPYGAHYEATKNGFRVTTKDFDYDKGAALLKSSLTFDDFVTAVKGGLVVLNIHTDAFNPGEISGRVGGGAYPSKPGAAHQH